MKINLIKDKKEVTNILVISKMKVMMKIVVIHHKIKNHYIKRRKNKMRKNNQKVPN